MLAFLHIPKTAGTSLATAISQALPAGELLICERPENYHYFNDAEISRGKIIFGHISVQFARILGVHHFATCLRHPLDRCISQVQHWLRADAVFDDTDEAGWPVKLLDRERDVLWNLESVLDHPDHQRWRQISNAMCHQLAFDHDYRVGGRQFDVLGAAKQTLESCMCLGMVGNLQSFSTGLSQLLGIRLGVGRRNVGREASASLQSAMQPLLRRRLEDCNYLDAQLYEFANSMCGSDGYYSNSAPHELATISIKSVTLPQVSVNDSIYAALTTMEGDFSLRLCHFIVDVHRMQRSNRAVGRPIVHLPLKSRELATICAISDRGDLVLLGGSCPSGLSETKELDNVLNAYLVAAQRNIINAPTFPGNCLIALLQAHCSAGDFATAVDRLFREFGGADFIVLANALTLYSSNNIALLNMRASQADMIAFATVDEHVLYCPRLHVMSYAAIAKAKFNDCKSKIVQIAGVDCIKLASSY